MLICGSLWWDCNYYFRISSRECLLDVLFFCMNFRVSNSMKIRRFRWNRNNRNKFIGINNVFTLKFYNWNWLLDVVGGYLLLRSFEALNLEFQVSRSFYFFTGGKLMYIYLHIDVAMCLFAIVEILKVTLIIIEKCKKH